MKVEKIQKLVAKLHDRKIRVRISHGLVMDHEYVTHINHGLVFKK